MKKILCGLQAPHITVINPPLLGTDVPNKTAVENLIAAAVTTNLTFFNTDGTQDDIEITAGDGVFFRNSDGSQDDIGLT